MIQSQRTIQEYTTTLSPAQVLQRARKFFTDRSSIYAAFIEHDEPAYCSFRGQGGEEIFIGTNPLDGGTRVTGSTYLYDMQVARFFTTLPPFAESEQLLPPQQIVVAES